MKTASVFLPILLVGLLIAGCSDLIKTFGNGKTITPSNVVISESRPVSNFTSIDMRALGKVTVTQGDSDSLTIKGSDNIVPLITTTVQNGVLVIEMVENIHITSINSDNLLTITIVVKDLSAITVSGASLVEMDSFSTPKLAITMSGAGQASLNHLTAKSLNVTVSGLGNVEIAGEVPQATFSIPGAGNIDAHDLKIHTANITVAGLGNATMWVTGQLTGEISGGGSVAYYGNPQTSTKATGLGTFKSLGIK
jgi:hypothetical protein